MWPFQTRADPEPKKTETESSGDALLLANLADDCMTKERAFDIPAFAACVNKIAETISTIPIKLYRLTDGELEEVKGDPRTRLINDETGDALDGVQFKRALIRDYLTGKGGYAFINRSGGRIKSFNYVKEEEVSFLFSPDPIFKDYDVMIRGARYKPFDFLKILRNTDNGWAGKSVIAESGEVLSVAYNSLKYEKGLVKTGGNKKGFIKSPRKLDEPAMSALKNAWRNLYGNNMDNVVILNEGLDFKEASNTSVEMQLNENKKANSDEICKLFEMPPAMINGGATDIDKANFVQFCLNPALKELECALNRDALLESEKGTCYFAADTSELTKGDMEKRFRAYEVASKSGFMQIDEVRLRENLPPLGLDFVRLGLQDVLYDPKTRQFYMPNMNQTGGLGKGRMKDEKENVRARGGRNLVVAGAPGSGKTTWVKEHKDQDDCVVDWDKIREAITGDAHTERPDLVPTLLDAREAILKRIEKGEEGVKWYVITTQSDRGKLSSMADRLHADVKIIDTPLETIINRINNDDTRADKDLHIRLATEWNEKWKKGERINED